MKVFEWVFWGSLLLYAYPYAIYPLLVIAMGLFRRGCVGKGDSTPAVTVLVPAHNEAEVIARTLECLLAQDYPKERLQILVASDGSTDGTDDIVKCFASRGVELHRAEPRRGKAAVLNAAATLARGEVLVFCDANAMFAPDTVRQLAANFDDPLVGYVTGSLSPQPTGGGPAGNGNSLFTRFENWLRVQETRAGSIIGSNGGVDAVRKALYWPVPEHLITDLVLPLSVLERGWRVVYDPQARSAEITNQDSRSEFRMRVRVALRAMQGLWAVRSLLSPVRHPYASFCIVSHKIIRYAGFLCMLAALLSNALLAAGSRPYAALLGLQLLAYALALLGFRQGLPAWTRRLTTLPSYLLLSYSAFAVASVKFLRGQSMAVWRPRSG